MCLVVKFEHLVVKKSAFSCNFAHFSCKNDEFSCNSKIMGLKVVG